MENIYFITDSASWPISLRVSIFFILFYSIGKGAEAFCHLGTQRSMHMETELSSALLSHPVTTVHFY